jgi:hypothetical protein
MEGQESYPIFRLETLITKGERLSREEKIDFLLLLHNVSLSPKPSQAQLKTLCRMAWQHDCAQATRLVAVAIRASKTIRKL